MSTHNDGDRRSDLAVMDANEYKNKRRLERILDAHDQVEEQAAEAYDLYVAGDISTHGKNIKLLRAVQKFIREVHNLLMDYSDHLDDDEQNPYWYGREDSPLGVLEMPNDDDIVFHGLRDVLYADEMYIEEWTEEVTGRHEADRVETYHQQHTVPEEVSWNAFILTKLFLSDQHDLEIQFEDMEDQRPISDWRDNDREATTDV